MRRRLIGLAVAGYLATAAFGVFGPNPGYQVSGVGNSLRQLEREAHSAVTGRPAAESGASPESPEDVWPYGDISAEDLANTALFVPFGLLFPLIWPRWRWWTIPAGVVLSAAIELSQMVIFSWRSASVEDIGWNSLGTRWSRPGRTGQPPGLRGHTDDGGARRHVSYHHRPCTNLRIVADAHTWQH